MGGQGQLYENMLMPLDDMMYGSDFKVATLSVAVSELHRLLGSEMQGLVTIRSISSAIVICENPDDFEQTDEMPRVYIKGKAEDVDSTLCHIKQLNLKISGISEVNPYAP